MVLCEVTAGGDGGPATSEKREEAMKSAFPWKRAALALFLAAAMSAGCAKRQTVGSASSGAAPPAAPQATAPSEMKEAPVQEAPVTEAPKATEPMRTAQAEAAAGVAVTEEKPSVFEDVHFDFDKAVLREDGKKLCQGVAAYAKAHPRATILIEGHCDERGTAEYNMALGERRATVVMNYLVSLGVPRSALSTVSFGKERPLDPGHNEEAWAKNRRAHFVVK
jgi:peptidoglycan-associated lipoprotein